MSIGKFDFQKVSFGLAQLPVYFQWLISEGLSGLNSAFRYLHDIAMYSPDPKTQLKHIDLIFQHLLKCGQKF